MLALISALALTLTLALTSALKVTLTLTLTLTNALTLTLAVSSVICWLARVVPGRRCAKLFSPCTANPTTCTWKIGPWHYWHLLLPLVIATFY